VAAHHGLVKMIRSGNAAMRDDGLMVHPTLIALPEAEYLTRIGRIAYQVSSMEWCILGDLELLAEAIPDDLSVGNLAGLTTGRIASRLRGATQEITSEPVLAYVRTAADALDDASKRRNHLLHARPATIDGQQRLYRWRLASGDQFPITIAWLDEQIAALNHWSVKMDSFRKAAHGAVTSG
jgi:hypothetical protein